ncbi:MAG: hypothetical protein QOG50_1757 [Actinomycetota bacterium]|nr:hypothetical protein [Actinomycetota bacterium]
MRSRESASDVALWIAIGLVVALLGFLFYAIAHERGPGAPDVAIGYERAWDELNFGLLWDLSGEELRDGMRRDQFIAAKRHAYANAEARGRLAEHIEVDTFVEGNQTALVVTRVAAEGASVRNDVLLERRANGWAVVGYSLRPSSSSS